MNRNRQITPDTIEIIIEGVTFLLGSSAAEEPFLPGQLYVGERNTGPKLLTCKRMSNDGSFVVAHMENGVVPYPYDAWECRRVIDIKSA